MKAKSAFTIVELIVTVAVAILVLSIAIPRYTTLQHQQDFSSAIQKIVGCMQQAQRNAVTPPIGVKVGNNTPRYSGYVLSQDNATPPNLTCTTYLYDGDYDSVLQATHTPQYWLQSQNALLGTQQYTVTVSDAQIELVTPQPPPYSYPAATNVQYLVVLFGVTEKGIPLAMIPCTAPNFASLTTANPDSCAQSAIVPQISNDITRGQTVSDLSYGSGFGMLIYIKNSFYRHSQISMGRYGVPIQVQNTTTQAQ